MGYGSIINKLNSFMENIEDPEQTEENLQAFNLGFNEMPTNQLEGEPSFILDGKNKELLR